MGGLARDRTSLACLEMSRNNVCVIPPSHHGRFAGSNRLWFMPGTQAHVSDGSLVVAADRVSVRWAHEGVQKEGELVLSGPGPSCRGDFTDTFHAATGLVLHGHVQGSAVLLYGTYPAGDGSPDWGWRIVLDWCDPDRFCFRMFNVLPSGAECLAVDLFGARAT
jgi:hypothetical protein